MSAWILVIMASTTTEPQIKVATYPTEAACRVAQHNLVDDLLKTMDGAIDKPDANGFVLGPAVNCIKS